MATNPPSSRLLALVALASGLILVGGCGSTGGDMDRLNGPEGFPLTRQPVPLDAPAPGSFVRIGGKLAATVSGSDADYRTGACRVYTPLPVGYPPPAPPDSRDLKTYPSVRLAEVTGAGHPDSGMKKTCWPLFNHIKGHGIAMTSPEEMNYRGMQGSDQSAPKPWSMAFLYRRPELNETGVEGRFVVRDSDPVTVIAVGMNGSYSMSLVQRGMNKIEQWLAANPEWNAAGDRRTLYYNGPALFWQNKWAEVQLPVRKSSRHENAAITSAGAVAGPVR
jgi:hypothetical protein